ncbi:FAD-dependent oxidoreductase, partial [Acidobacteriota bacterium]
GLEFHLGSQVIGAKALKTTVTVTVKDQKGKTDEITCDRLLVSVGRRPYSQGLDLEKAGVKTDKSGFVVVDEKFATSVPGIYAIGDLIPGPMLAHKAEEEGVAVAELLSGKPGHVNYRAIPNIVYTWPELAHLGMTEEEAKEKGMKIKVGKYYFKSNGRAKCMDSTDGLVKILSDADSDRLLGVHILGPYASELIAELVMAFEFQASAEDVARTIHAHPTLSEVVKEAALAVDKRSIHG